MLGCSRLRDKLLYDSNWYVTIIYTNKQDIWGVLVWVKLVRFSKFICSYNNAILCLHLTLCSCPSRPINK